MIDRLYINDIDVQNKHGFWLEWKKISAPSVKKSYQDIKGADGQLDFTEADGRVLYDMRTLTVNMVHPEKDYANDLDEIMSHHGERCYLSFESDPDHYYTGRLNLSTYDVKKRKLTASALVYPYRLEWQETIVKAMQDMTVKLYNDAMPVSPKVDVVGSVTIKWRTYQKSLTTGSYYIDEFLLGKNEMLPVQVTFLTAGSVSFTYRKGRL